MGVASSPVGGGWIRLSDGAVLKLKILIVDVRESGFSPFGGVNFDVKVVGGVAVESVPEEVKKLVANKPLALQSFRLRVGSCWVLLSRDLQRHGKLLRVQKENSWLK